MPALGSHTCPRAAAAPQGRSWDAASWEQDPAACPRMARAASVRGQRRRACQPARGWLALWRCLSPPVGALPRYKGAVCVRQTSGGVCGTPQTTVTVGVRGPNLRLSRRRSKVTKRVPVYYRFVCSRPHWRSPVQVWRAPLLKYRSGADESSSTTPCLRKPGRDARADWLCRHSDRQ